jgi:hypothetical protein
MRLPVVAKVGVIFREDYVGAFEVLIISPN